MSKVFENYADKLPQKILKDIERLLRNLNYVSKRQLKIAFFFMF